MQVVRCDAEGHGELNVIQRALKLFRRKRTRRLVRRLSGMCKVAKVCATNAVCLGGLAWPHRRTKHRRLGLEHVRSTCVGTLRRGCNCGSGTVFLRKQQVVAPVIPDNFGLN